MSDEIDKELSELWASRGENDPEKLERLYHLIVKVLHNYKQPFKRLEGLDGLGNEQRSDYVNDFFMDKVLSGGTATRCDHIGALKTFYKRYIEDIARQYERRHKKEIPNYVNKGEAGEGNHNDETDITDECAYQHWDDQQRTGRDVLEHLDPFTEVGLSSAGVFEAVRAFIDKYAESDDVWVILFLGYHYCQDADKKEVLSKLAKRKHIASYAYKAEKLGFNWRDESNYQAFAKQTLLGQWLCSLGIELLPENRFVIAEILKILCAQTLNWVEQQNNDLD